jgi:hypothetical protein
MAEFASQYMHNQKLIPMSQKERFDKQKEVGLPSTRVQSFGNNDINFYSPGNINTKFIR